MKEKPSTVGVLVAVAVLVWIFLIELNPMYILFGIILYFTGFVCFRAGISATKEAKDKDREEENTEEDLGFKTYDDMKKEALKGVFKKDFDPNDPKVQQMYEENRKFIEKIRAERRASKESLEQTDEEIAEFYQ